MIPQRVISICLWLRKVLLDGSIGQGAQKHGNEALGMKSAESGGVVVLWNWMGIAAEGIGGRLLRNSWEASKKEGIEEICR